MIFIEFLRDRIVTLLVKWKKLTNRIGFRRHLQISPRSNVVPNRTAITIVRFYRNVSRALQSTYLPRRIMWFEIEKTQNFHVLRQFIGCRRNDISSSNSKVAPGGGRQVTTGEGVEWRATTTTIPDD